MQIAPKICQGQPPHRMYHPNTDYLLTSSASATEPSSDTLSPPGEGRDLCRHDDSHLAGPVRCRGEKTDDDDNGDEVASVMVAPPRVLVELNTQCYTDCIYNESSSHVIRWWRVVRAIALLDWEINKSSTTARTANCGSKSDMNSNLRVSNSQSENFPSLTSHFQGMGRSPYPLAASNLI